MFVVHDGLQVVRLPERVDFVHRLFGEVFQSLVNDVLRPYLDVLVAVRAAYDVIITTSSQHSHNVHGSHEQCTMRFAF